MTGTITQRDIVSAVQIGSDTYIFLTAGAETLGRQTLGPADDGADQECQFEHGGEE